MSFVPRTPEELAAVWPDQLDHVSASSLKQFARCPEQWRQVRLQGRRQRPAGAVIQGKADHQAIGTHFKTQIDTGVGLALPDVQDVFVETFEREVNDAGLSEIDWGAGATPSKAAAKVKDAGVRLVGQYHQEVAQYVKPAAVEESFQIDVEGLPVRVDGFIDLRGHYVSPFTGEPLNDVVEPVIIERKTAARVGMNPETRLQARVYQLVHPEPVDVHVSVKRGHMEWGTPELRVPYSFRGHRLTVQMVGMALRALATYYVSYGPDHPWPGNITHPWACNYCGFRNSCHWWTEYE